MQCFKKKEQMGCVLFGAGATPGLRVGRHWIHLIDTMAREAFE